MSRIKYSVTFDEKDTAKAIGYELRISPRKSMELCREIKGMFVKDAKEYINDVIKLKRAVPFKRYKRDVPHRKGKGIMAGRYPKNAAKEILKTIENAESNADYKGLDTENLAIAHISAQRGRKTKGTMPRAFGRATAKEKNTTNIEVILREIEE